MTQIRKKPSEALPSPRMLRALKVLSNDPNNCIFVISGRDQRALDEWIGGLPSVGLSAEHGSFMKYPTRDGLPPSSWINFAEDMDLSWMTDLLPIFQYYTERTPGSMIERKLASLTWHYRLADPEYGSWQAKEFQIHLENAYLSKLPLEIILGKKNLEVLRADLLELICEGSTYCCKQRRDRTEVGRRIASAMAV